MAEPAIEVSDLRVALGGHRVLGGVDLRVERGDYLALIGPNGGGKTTLLRTFVGLVRPEHGEVRVLGGSPRAARGRVGYVPQRPQFDPSLPMSVRDVVRMGRLRRGRPWAVRRESEQHRVQATMEEIGVDALAERPVGVLSAGELQRVLIARAMAMEPELLLLDEPTASLDTHGAETFYRLIDHLARRVTVVLVTHDMGVSSRVRRIVWLNARVADETAEAPSRRTLEEVYGCPVDVVMHGARHTTGSEAPAASGSGDAEPLDRTGSGDRSGGEG